MQALIDAGYSHRLWAWTQYDNQAIFIRPVDDSGDGFPGTSGQCPFQTKDGLCELHDKGLKPMEGRIAIHDDHLNSYLVPKRFRRALDKSWGKGEGRRIVQQFLANGGATRDEARRQWFDRGEEKSRQKELNREIIL
jgi:hypothetical protein